MGTLPRNGKMASVFAQEALAAEAIVPYQDSVSIAAINGPQQTVISANKQAVQAVLENLESDFIITRLLNVSHAFHLQQYPIDTKHVELTHSQKGEAR